VTLFFDLNLLEKAADKDMKKFVAILYAFYYKKLPSRRKGALYVKKLNIGGFSFLLNPDPLFTLKNIDIAYIVQYIKLAARRDYNLYKYYKVKSLPLSYFPDINMQAIRTNPLLNITNTEIFFKYEELKKEK
jgi:hypothetical protein